MGAQKKSPTLPKPSPHTCSHLNSLPQNFANPQHLSDHQPKISPKLNPKLKISAWFATCSGLAYLTLFVGGLTRLSESGLSMTDWSILKGIKPPITDSDWQNEFDRYKNFPEYEFKLLANDFEMKNFKAIFWPEYIHRMLGRAVALCYLAYLPFALRSKHSLCSPAQTSMIGMLIVAQGLYGWYMVKSGLNIQDGEIPRVSYFRLANHFTLATLFIMSTYWMSLKHYFKRPISASKPFKYATIATFALSFLTSYVGCLVAGLDAGEIYNTWPLMNGKLVPSALRDLKIAEYVYQPVSIQFTHRITGTLTLIAMQSLYLARKRYNISRNVSLALKVGLISTYSQVALGISTLYTKVWMPLASSHQINAIFLMGSILTGIFFI